MSHDPYVSPDDADLDPATAAQYRRDRERDDRSEANGTVVAKQSNMDGDTYEGRRFKLSCAIAQLGRQAYLADTAAMFNCNYDPETAAREWLQQHLANAPQRFITTARRANQAGAL